MSLNSYNGRNISPGASRAYYPIAASDFGVLGPGVTGGTPFGNGNLTNVASGGSLANGSFFAKITWVTAFGESLPSAEGTVTVTGGPSGSVTIALGSISGGNSGPQANAQPIIGWRIYSGSVTNTELANEAAASLSVSLSTQILPDGTSLLYIPIATTSATVKVLGAGAALPVVNNSGAQYALPSVAANTTADLDIKVPLTFKPQAWTGWKRPSVTSDTAGVTLDAVDCIGPVWPASTSVTAGQFISIGSRLFQCIVAGTTSAAASVPNFASVAKYGTIVDNGATWKNVGGFRLARLRFGNSTGAAVQPTANEYDLFQS